MKIKIFSDGAIIEDMLRDHASGSVDGFTTNPTLMREAGVTDYLDFATQAAKEITSPPLSFEVFSDEFDEMKKQAQILNKLGSNIYVKIPITNTRQESSLPLIHDLAQDGVKLNITAIMTLGQVSELCDALIPVVPSFISVFAGRIADTLRNPQPIMLRSKEIIQHSGLEDSAELLWASCRQVYNIKEAQDSGCDIITVPPKLIKKLSLRNKNLEEYSLETVKMFYDDAQSVGYKL